MSVLESVKTILNNEITDEQLTVFLNMAKTELLAWTMGDTTLELPSWLEPIQVMAVVTGFNQQGAEGETYQTVDGVTHSFSYPTMIEYIHSNAPSHAKLI